MSYVYCTSCGTKAQGNQRFCANCGAAISPVRSVEPVETTKTPVVIQTLTGPPLRVNALLAYTSQTKSLELFDETSKIPPTKVDFNADNTARLERYGKNSVLLTFWPKSAGLANVFRIDFPDEASATALMIAMPKKGLGDEGLSGGASSSGLSTLGVLILLVGMGIVAYFYFFFSTAVDVPTTTINGQSFGGGQVNNLGLMNDRMIGIIIGIAACLIGTALWLFGRAKAVSTAKQ